MSDTFEKTLLDAIEKLNAKISAAEERIIGDQQLIDECSHEKETFQTLLKSYLEKRRSDSEALATLYTSGKTHGDFATFSTGTGIALPDAVTIAVEDD